MGKLCNKAYHRPLRIHKNCTHKIIIVLGLLGPFPASIKVWATICDPTCINININIYNMIGINNIFIFILVTMSNF